MTTTIPAPVVPGPARREPCPPWCTAHRAGSLVADEDVHASDYIRVPFSLAAPVAWESGAPGPDLLLAALRQEEGSAPVVGLVHAGAIEGYLPDMTPDEADQLADLLRGLAAQARSATA